MSDSARQHRWLLRSTTLAARLMRTCVEMRHYSAGNNHRVGFSGLLRVALAGNRSRGGASDSPKMFPNGDSGSGACIAGTCGKKCSNGLRVAPVVGKV